MQIFDSIIPSAQTRLAGDTQSGAPKHHSIGNVDLADTNSEGIHGFCDVYQQAQKQAWPEPLVGEVIVEGESAETVPSEEAVTTVSDYVVEEEPEKVLTSSHIPDVQKDAETPDSEQRPVVTVQQGQRSEQPQQPAQKEQSTQQLDPATKGQSDPVQSEAPQAEPRVAHVSSPAENILVREMGLTRTTVTQNTQSAAQDRLELATNRIGEAKNTTVLQHVLPTIESSLSSQVQFKMTGSAVVMPDVPNPAQRGAVPQIDSRPTLLQNPVADVQRAIAEPEPAMTKPEQPLFNRRIETQSTATEPAPREGRAERTQPNSITPPAPPPVPQNTQQQPPTTTLIPAATQTELSTEAPSKEDQRIPGVISFTDVRAASRAQAMTAATTAIARTDTGQSVTQQVALAVRTQFGAENTVEVSLHPAELGRLRMSMTTSEAGMVVTILAERAETLELMRRNIDDLARSFSEMGHDDPTFNFEQGSNFDQGDDRSSQDSFVDDDRGLNLHADDESEMHAPVLHTQGSGVDILL